MIKHKLFCACKHDLWSALQSLWYTIWAKLRIKSHDLLNNCRKSFWQRVTSILIQSLSGYTWNILNGIQDKTTANIQLSGKEVKSDSEVCQLCPTLGDPRDCSLSGSSVHGIFQASVLEWGAIAFSGNLVRNMQIKTTARECSAPVWKAILSLQRKTVEKTWRKENT